MKPDEALNEFWDNGHVVYRNNRIDHCLLHSRASNLCFSVSWPEGTFKGSSCFATMPLALKGIDQFEEERGR